MLTKQDLDALGNLIDEKLDIKLEEKLESKLEEKLESKLEEKLKPIHDDIKTIKKDVKKLRKDLDDTINFFDKEDLVTRKKINKTRNELGMSDITFTN